MNKTVQVEPNYSRIFDYLIHEAKFQPEKMRNVGLDCGQHNTLLIEMLEYGKRLHLASVEVIAVQRAASRESI